MIILEANGLRKEYGKGEGLVRALDGIDLQVEKGEFLSVVGTSGSGKSTLLHMIGGLDNPSSGEVIINNKKIAQMNEEELTIFRRREIGFIFQNYNLVPMLTACENIVLPTELDGAIMDKTHFDMVIKKLHLDKMLHRYPSQLSGGQQQRVAIARALVSKPAIILADEPTGNLDVSTSNEVIGLLKSSCKAFNQTLVMITHNNEIAQLTDRIVRIEDGKIKHSI